MQENYIVYDTHDPSGFFINIMEIFFRDAVIKGQLIANQNNNKNKSSINMKYTDALEGQKFFLCKSYNPTCTYQGGKVILSNIQLKFFLRCHDEYLTDIDQIYSGRVSEEVKQSETAVWQGSVAQVLTFRPKVPNFEYINIIDNGEIKRCEPAMKNIREQYPHGMPAYPHITDAQTEDAFFNGIVNSLDANDTIKLVTSDHNPAVVPSASYTAFEAKCVPPKTIIRSCCSIHTNPDCELLKEERCRAARKMKTEGIPLADIAQATGLSIQIINQLPILTYPQ